MCKLDEWRDISFQLADALTRHGVTDTLVLRKLFDGSHEEAARMVSEMGCGSEVVDELVMLWEASRFSAFTRLQLLASFSTLEASVARVQEERVHKRIRLQLQSTVRAAGAAAPSESVQFPIRKWPTRLRSSCHGHRGQRPEQEWSCGRVCDALGSVWIFREFAGGRSLHF